jgi:tRNA pseudouridine55 synthase
MSFLLSAEDALSDMPALEISSRQAADLRFGKKIPFDINADQDGRTYYRACREGKLIAVVYPAEENGRTILRIERLFDHD